MPKISSALVNTRPTSNINTQVYRIETHPAIDIIRDYLRSGKVTINGVDCTDGVKLVTQINKEYPDNRINSQDLAKLKTKMLRHSGGYEINNDGDVVHVGNEPIVKVEVMDMLYAAAQIGLRNLINNPEVVTTRDWINILKLIREFEVGPQKIVTEGDVTEQIQSFLAGLKRGMPPIIEGVVESSNSANSPNK